MTLNYSSLQVTIIDFVYFVVEIINFFLVAVVSSFIAPLSMRNTSLWLDSCAVESRCARNDPSGNLPSMTVFQSPVPDKRPFFYWVAALLVSC